MAHGSSYDELKNIAKPYPEAIPILVRFLPIVRHDNIKMAIVRALTPPEFLVVGMLLDGEKEDPWREESSQGTRLLSFD